MFTIKRKVIQIANSTHLVSIPRKWALRNNIVKGQELDVTEDGDRLIISNKEYSVHKKAELDISNLDVMTSRVIHALYKKGVDELKLTYDNPELIQEVTDSLGKESQGFEILEHGKNYCVIKHVIGAVEEFQPLLRRTFLLLSDMADQTYSALKNGEFDRLNAISKMEETNNRFTTICRRYLNRSGHAKFPYLGPLYYVVEDLENLADHYKYICQYYYNLRQKPPKISKEALKYFQESNALIKYIIDVFYRFDIDKMIQIKRKRKTLVDEAFVQFGKFKKSEDLVLLHHSIAIMQKVFCLNGPILILNFKDTPNKD